MMIPAFLILHIRQLSRLLKELGFVRSLLLLFILLAALAKIFTLEAGKFQAYLLGALPLILAVSIHATRKDKQFLKILNIHRYCLYAFSYHLLAAPFYLRLLLQGDWIKAVFSALILSLIPYFEFNFQNRVQRTSKLYPIPYHAFEWRSGIRKYGLFSLLLYTLALVLYPYPFISLLAIVIFTFITTVFYQEAEPRQMVEVFQLPPRQFIRLKWKMQLMLFWIACTPLMLLFLISIPAYWYVMLILIVISSIIQMLSICMKYSFYEPGVNTDKSIFIIIYSLSLFVPFFVPVPLIMLFNYYRKAVKNLKNYLHDQY